MASSPSAGPNAPVDLSIDKEKLKKAFDVSHFDFNAVLRGAQLTLVGGELALLCEHGCFADVPRDAQG